MHVLEVCIANTRSTIYGVVVTLPHLKETLRGREKRDAEYVRIPGVEKCTRTHTKYRILKMRVGDGEEDRK
jgi:hypothetical protein